MIIEIDSISPFPLPPFSSLPSFFPHGFTSSYTFIFSIPFHHSPFSFLPFLVSFLSYLFMSSFFNHLSLLSSFFSWFFPFFPLSLFLFSFLLFPSPIFSFPSPFPFLPSPYAVVDSWGKFSDGLMVGNLKEIGFFKECLDITVFQPPPDLQEPQKLPQHHPDVLLQPQSALSMLLSRSSLPYKRILNEEGANLYHSTDPSSSTTESRPSLLQADFTGQYCLVTYA